MTTAQAGPVNVTGTGAVSASPCTFRGLNVFSTAGATVALYDHASATSGTVLAKFVLAAGGDKQITVPDGVRCAAGIYLSASAAIEGSVLVG